MPTGTVLRVPYRSAILADVRMTSAAPIPWVAMSSPAFQADSPRTIS